MAILFDICQNAFRYKFEKPKRPQNKKSTAMNMKSN